MPDAGSFHEIFSELVVSGQKLRLFVLDLGFYRAFLK